MNLIDSRLAGERVYYASGSQGTVAGNQFTSAAFSLYSNQVTVDGNTFSREDPVYTSPSLVEKFLGNTFSDSGATIHIFGSTASEPLNPKWPVINNVSRYSLDSDVVVRPFITLTIEPDVEVNTPGRFEELYVDGVLNAAGMTFTGNTVINNNPAACAALGLDPIDQIRIRLAG